MLATITGVVLEMTTRKFPSGDTYQQGRILVGKSDVVTVSFKPDRLDGQMPREGEVVEVDVSVRAFVTKSGAPGLGVDAVAVRPSESALLPIG